MKASNHRTIGITNLLFALLTSVWNGAGQEPTKESGTYIQVAETKLCTLRLARTSGDLVGIFWKHPALEIIHEPRLGENFRLLLPHPGHEATYFNSHEQRVDRIEADADGVTCSYDSLRREDEELPVKVRYNIRAVEGRLEFSIEIDNPTKRPLAEVVFGMVGGQHGLENRTDTQSLIPGTSWNTAPALFTSFQGGSYGGGNLGIRYSANAYTYPSWNLAMGWIEFYNRKADLGLYYANHDPESRLTAFHSELHPFNKTAVIGDNWPTSADVPPGEPIGLTMGWINFPYTKQGVFRAGPVVLQLHRGDWHEGSQLYRAWFDQHFNIQRKPGWLRQEMAWQSTILSGPEDRIANRFKDLPRLAADAKKYGVTTLEICGWDIGGIDRAYPEYQPDPRLGSHEEFRQALSEMRRMGVHPLLFANFQFADTATPLFKKGLHKYTVKGRWADDWWLYGWGEATISARMGLTRSMMTRISPSHARVRKLLVDQFLDLIRDGAEGFQFDKASEIYSLDFNPLLKVSPDRSLPQGLLETYDEILRKGRILYPPLAIASETSWDRAFQYVDVSYLRMNSIDMGDTALRYTFPEWTATIFAENPGDFNVMNNGMRYGFVWALAPRHYNDSMDEPLTRPLSEYVRELLRMRQKHKDLLFYGRFRDTIGATLKGSTNVHYSVFEQMDKADRKAVVVVNYGNSEEAAEVNWSGGEGTAVEISRPFKPDENGTLPAKVTLAPRTCAVVIQKEGK